MNYQISAAQADINNFSILDEYLEKLCLSSKALNFAITRYGMNNIGEFIKKTNIIKNDSYQPCEDLIKIIHEYVLDDWLKSGWLIYKKYDTYNQVYRKLLEMFDYML